MKILSIFLGMVIVALIGTLVFVPSQHAPSAPPAFQLSFPFPNALVTSPVGIEGTITGGGWFFEGSFPVQVIDGNGTVLGEGIAQALGDWMTTGTIQFSANIPFSAARFATGTIVFSKDDPSGDSSAGESLALPVRFK